MNGYRCGDCGWFDTVHESVKLIPIIAGKTKMGFCRKHKPGYIQLNGFFYGVQIVMDSEEYCGEFRGGNK